MTALGLVFAHYQWSASSSGNPFRFGEDQSDYYNLLSDALLAGQLHLLIPPSPELTRLPDPYDPVANAPYRLYHDVSLHAGRYYLSFGITPALTLFIPFRVLFRMDLPEGFAVVLFMFGGAVFCLAILRLMVRRFLPAAPFGLGLAGLALFAFGNFAPFILRRPRIYEVAVASGFFFLAGAAYWLLRGITGERPKTGLFALVSLFLGLAVGSRPHHILAAPFLLAAVLHTARRDPQGGWRAYARPALSLGGPLALCGLGLLLYNWARFGAWLEFGQTYVLAPYSQGQPELFSFSYLPPHLFIHLLSPPSVDLDFPFFHLYPAVLPQGVQRGDYFNSVSGLLPCVPLAGLAFFSPLLLLPTFRTAVATVPAAIASAFAALGVLILLVVCCFMGVSARYFADFAPPLLLSAALCWISLDAWLAKRRAARFILNATLGLLLAYGTVVNLAVGLTGYYDLFRKQNPTPYFAIEDRFVPVQRLLLWLGPPYGDLRMTVRFPAASPPRTESLVSVGAWGGADILCVRYRDDEHIVFRFHHGGKWIRSHAIPISAGRTYLLEVSMGSLLPAMNERALSRFFPGHPDPKRRLSVRLDGEEVLSGSFDFEPKDPSYVTLRRTHAGGDDCPSAFTGEVLEFRQGVREAAAGRTR